MSRSATITELDLRDVLQPLAQVEEQLLLLTESLSEYEGAGHEELVRALGCLQTAKREAERLIPEAESEAS